MNDGGGEGGGHCGEAAGEAEAVRKQQRGAASELKSRGREEKGAKREREEEVEHARESKRRSAAAPVGLLRSSHHWSSPAQTADIANSTANCTMTSTFIARSRRVTLRGALVMFCTILASGPTPTARPTAHGVLRSVEPRSKRLLASSGCFAPARST